MHVINRSRWEYFVRLTFIVLHNSKNIPTTKSFQLTIIQLSINKQFNFIRILISHSSLEFSWIHILYSCKFSWHNIFMNCFVAKYFSGINSQSHNHKNRSHEIYNGSQSTMGMGSWSAIPKFLSQKLKFKWFSNFSQIFWPQKFGAIRYGWIFLCSVMAYTLSNPPNYVFRKLQAVTRHI